MTRGEGTPEIIKETAVTALVDGKNILGVVVGNYCMDLAIKKAKESGIGWVIAKGMLLGSIMLIASVLLMAEVIKQLSI